MIPKRKRRQLNKARPGEFMITIFSWHETYLSGRIKHVASDESCAFESLLEMLALIEERLDDMNLVQPAMEIRSWGEPLPGEEVEVMDSVVTDKTNSANLEYINTKPDFIVRVLMRQNASWQGELCWLNSGKTVHFRSLLELIMLMQEAMEISGQPEADYSFRSWSDSSANQQCR